MKAIKTIGLAALAALAAMAFVGASSAMAENTTLCSADGSGCGVTHVHETSVTNAKLLTSIGTTECAVLFLGDVKGAALASPLVLEGTFTYSSCKLGSTSCTATEESGPSEIKVLKEGHETTKVTGEGLVKLVCGEGLNCAYNGVGLVGTGKGPLLSTQKNGEVTTTEKSVTKEAGGFLCPKTSKLDITTTPLSATYLTESGGGGGGGGWLTITPEKWVLDYSDGPRTKEFKIKNTSSSTIEDLEIWTSVYWNIYYRSCGKILASGAICIVNVEALTELSVSTLYARSKTHDSLAEADLVSYP